MTLNPVSLGILLAVLFVGYFIGLYEGRWKHGKSLSALEQERDALRAEMQETRDKLVALRQDYEQLANAPDPDLSISGRDDATQVYLDGELLSPTEMSAAQHQRLLKILTYLTPYIKRGQASKPAAPPQKPQPKAAPARTIKPRPAAASPTSPAAAGAEAVSEPLSIVAQIDRILQARLENTPLASLGIRLEEDLDAGVIIWVGIKRYVGLDAVPDENIRQVIQSAIDEWNRLQ